MTLSAGRISLLAGTLFFLIATILALASPTKLPFVEAGLFFTALGLFLG